MLKIFLNLTYFYHKLLKINKILKHDLNLKANFHKLYNKEN